MHLAQPDACSAVSKWGRSRRSRPGALPQRLPTPVGGRALTAMSARGHGNAAPQRYSGGGGGKEETFHVPERANRSRPQLRDPAALQCSDPIGVVSIFVDAGVRGLRYRDRHPEPVVTPGGLCVRRQPCRASSCIEPRPHSPGAGNQRTCRSRQEHETKCVPLERCGYTDTVLTKLQNFVTAWCSTTGRSLVRLSSHLSVGARPASSCLSRDLARGVLGSASRRAGQHGAHHPRRGCASGKPPAETPPPAGHQQSGTLPSGQRADPDR